jgi:DNA helicase-2/ATP-dependent DNA helicase PcrA
MLIEKVPDRVAKLVASAREPSRKGALEMLVAPTADDEARAIAARAESLLNEGFHPGDIGVLYRSVRTSAQPLVSALRARGIPFAVVGKTSLLARPEMALMAHVLVYWSGGTWYPNPDFAPEVVTRESLLSEIAAVAGCTDQQAATALRRLDKLGDVCRREGVTDSVLVFNNIVTALRLPGLGDEAKSKELGLGQVSELLTLFDHASRRAIPYEIHRELARRDVDEANDDEVFSGEKIGERKVILELTPGQLYLMRLRAFLEEFAGRAAEETPDATRSGEDVVQIMTVHRAKGLEFPIVFVPCLVEGRFPSRLMGSPQLWYVPPEMFDRRRYEGREDDEARLLYVALTRAKELLVVSWFEQHKTKATTPSRFVTQYLRPALPGMRRLGEAVPAIHTGELAPVLVDVEFSSLVTFQECAYKYWLRHVCGFQPPLAKELGFGKLLHHVVAELARRAIEGFAATAEDVDRIIEQSFYLPFAGPIPATNLRRAAANRIKAYVQDYADELTRCVRPEMRFEVPLGHARVRGRIDLVLHAEGSSRNEIELIDFKTSSNRPPSEMHKNQLRLYAAAAERMGYEPVAMGIHDLDSECGGRYPVPDDPDASEAFAESLSGWVQQIREGRFSPTKDRLTCEACDFRSFCMRGPSSSGRVRAM